MERSHTCITIIPAYNEEESIETVVLGALQHTDVCVINDGSIDSTPAIVNTIEGIHVIHHIKNAHIPGCIIDGMRYAVEQGYRHAITMDAGLSHDTREIPLFLEHGEADLVLGCRVVHMHTPLYRRLLSRAGNLFYNTCLDFPRSLVGRQYRDMTSGFRMYSARAMNVILSHGLRSRSFDVMLETAHLVYAHKLRIEEVDISYRFSNSSLKSRVLGDCLCMCMKLLVRSFFRKARRLLAAARLPHKKKATILHL
jgi:dolichol-phosphate mannosyltransferase